MGRRGGHVRRRVPVPRRDHLPRDVCGEPGRVGCGVLDRVRGLQARVRAGQRCVRPCRARGHAADAGGQ